MPTMRTLRMTTLPILVGLLLLPGLGRAQTAERPIQISLVNPVQIYDEDTSIRGLRVNILYGRNRDMKGVDIGFIAGHTTGDGKGVQWNLVNITDGMFTGFQWGAVNLIGGQSTAFQLGWFNRTQAPSESFQWGLVNVAEDMSGFQLGFVNFARQMHGLQIGLVNIIQSKEKLPVFPIVNWSY
jgi:hypothetical protein